MPQLITMKISYFYDCQEYIYTYDVYVNNLNELKTEFLKRFGNIDNISNKLKRQKPLIKEITYTAKNIEAWVEMISDETDWNVSFK